MRLVDSHCHLQAERFEGDRDAVIAAAVAAGVERMLVPGWDLASSAAALSLAGRHDWLDAGVGIHPHDAARADPAAWQGIIRLAGDRRVVAIGETGLDYDRMFSPVAAQLDNLRRHLELGQELAKPVILHCRSATGSSAAHEALLEELERAGIARHDAAVGSAVRRPPPAVLHSFSGTEAFAEDALARGLAISVSGLAFRKGEEATATVASSTPADRLLVETDAPYLSPPGAPRQRNEPAWVRVTAAWIAGLRTAGQGEAALGSFGAGLVAAYDATFRR